MVAIRSSSFGPVAGDSVEALVADLRSPYGPGFEVRWDYGTSTTRGSILDVRRTPVRVAAEFHVVSDSEPCGTWVDTTPGSARQCDLPVGHDHGRHNWVAVDVDVDGR